MNTPIKLPVLWRRAGVSLSLRHQQDVVDLILKHRSVFEAAAAKNVHPDFGRHMWFSLSALDRLDGVPLEQRLLNTLSMLNQLYVMGSMTRYKVPDEDWVHLLSVILTQGWNASATTPEHWSAYLDYLAIIENPKARCDGLSDPRPRVAGSLPLQLETIKEVSASLDGDIYPQLFAIADEIGITGDQTLLKVGPVTVQLSQDALFLRRRAQERQALSEADGSRNFFEGVMRIPYGGDVIWHISISKTCNGQVHLFKRVSKVKIDQVIQGDQYAEVVTQ